MKKIELYINEKREIIDKILQDMLTPASPRLEEIYQAMRYTLFPGGKRIRPVLALASYESVKGENPNRIAPIACAIELIHTYSLIHDDLPAMDNDPIRRGKPSNHMVYGEGMAVLAGDGLLTEAFRYLAEGLEKLNIPPKTGVRVIKLVAEKAGVEGMVGGQALDLRKEEMGNGEDLLQEIAYRKTGAMIECSVLLGGLLAGASEDDIQKLSIYGKNVGITFQIVDDLLDILGDEEKVGKKLRKEKGRFTYPNILGVEGSRKEALSLTKKAKKAVSTLKKGDLLEDLADFLLERAF